MAQIDHVIVLALENRSFDHLLGFLDHPDPGFPGLAGTRPCTNPGWDGGPAVAATLGAKQVLPSGPDHSHDAVMEQLALHGRGAARRPTNQGFVASYERKGRGLAPATYGGLLAPLIQRLKAGNAQPAVPPIVGRGPLVMLCQSPENVPVLSRLALEFGVCTRWFCSVPGETWPNRNFLHAATSDGETDIDLRFYTNRTIFELLEEHGRSWRIYHDDTPQVWAFVHLWDTPQRHANWFPLTAFADHVAHGTLPAYSFIEPNHRPPLHTLDHDPVIGSPDVSNSQHPENNLVSDAAYDSFVPREPTDFARAEMLIASVYESLRANPEAFERSVLLITYDEHGGLYDHVPPPVDVPAPHPSRSALVRLMHLLFHRNASAFDFRMLGPRVPAVVVSPRIPAGTLCTDLHDHATVPATLRALFAPDAAPLTPRDAWARPFHTHLTLDEPRTDLPDLSRYLPATRARAGTGPEIARETAPETGTAPAGAAHLPEHVPVHYQPFADLAEDVRGELERRGVPEALVPADASAPMRSRQATSAFMAEAHRLRQDRAR